MIAAVAVFSCMDALLKLLSAYYPPLQVAVLRGAASLPFTLLPVVLAGRLKELRPRRFRVHLLRGVLSVVLLGSFVYAVHELSLANAYAVFLSAPLIVAGLSVPLLGERSSAGTWAAILAGLAGVIIMLRPSSAGLFSLGALAALVGAVAYALSAIAVRVLTRTESTVSVVFWTISLMTVMATMLAAPGWVAIAARHWPWIALLGVVAAIAQHLLTHAFRLAPPSLVAPFEYTALLWGIAIDRIIWHVLPSARVLTGGGVVIASGLFLIWRESRQPWQAAAEQGRMPPQSSSTVEHAARLPKEDSP
ncbi:MAG: DMT family transporter [Steroidobacterales bacterium]|jgi:drug/metabolite transporter (DMT)-like permease